ncbi:hypothetical protein ABZ924_36235 [Streptomyces sp. NPDC046876]
MPALQHGLGSNDPVFEGGPARAKEDARIEKFTNVLNAYLDKKDS